MQSRVGHGSCFTFTVTVKVGTGSTVKPRRRPADLKGVPALLVDDNETNLHILEKMLEGFGMRPIGVGNAREAIEVLENWDLESSPLPIVVTDVHMPVTDGFQFVQQIRERETISGVPVIILTSGARSQDAELCKQLDVVTRIMKPVKQAEILDALVTAQGHALPADQDDSERTPETLQRTLDSVVGRGWDCQPETGGGYVGKMGPSRDRGR